MRENEKILFLMGLKTANKADHPGDVEERAISTSLLNCYKLQYLFLFRC